MSFPTSIDLSDCERDSLGNYICGMSGSSSPSSPFGDTSPGDSFDRSVDKAVDVQQRTIGIGVRVGVGLFLLFAGLAFWAFRRHSKKRMRQINQQAQTQVGVLHPKMQQTNPQQSWMRQGEEVDGLAYRTEVEAQSKPHQHQPYTFQEMNAHPYGDSQFQGGPIVEAQGTHDAQEMPLSYRQYPPQEMPGSMRDGGVERR
ncbi:hypothetical protein G6011_11030 [Alternaria panax]|uniref:Uncharacterized protein n=1 Tax=Alternaria panax TaxID=48097 RepID=A0AAD4ICR5_9PLEO|nr:hypothetical protein G6011_11030 [Alternaria panax]